MLRVCASYHFNVHFTNVEFRTTNNINPCASLKQTHTYIYVHPCTTQAYVHILQNENCMFLFIYILPLIIKYFYKLCFCCSFPYLCISL